MPVTQAFIQVWLISLAGFPIFYKDPVRVAHEFLVIFPTKALQPVWLNSKLYKQSWCLLMSFMMEPIVHLNGFKIYAVTQSDWVVLHVNP